MFKEKIDLEYFKNEKFTEFLDLIDKDFCIEDKSDINDIINKMIFEVTHISK